LLLVAEARDGGEALEVAVIVRRFLENRQAEERQLKVP
jgi:hypothetical protein